MKIIYENDDGGVSIVIPAPMGAFRYLQMTTPSEMEAYSDRFKGTAEELAEALGRKKLTNEFIASIYGRDERGIFYSLNEGIWLIFIAMKDLSKEVDFEIVDDSEIPTDRTFRDAWKKDGKTVDVDMDKAQKIHMDRIREVRNKELDKTDIDAMKNIERGRTSPDLAKKRQDLRAIPATFDLTRATSPDELKTLWPVDLPRP